MSVNIAENTTPHRRVMQTSKLMRGARKPYAPGVREPYRLPEDKVKIPPLPPAPPPPPNVNWLIALLPPILIIGGMLAFRPESIGLMGTSIVMSLGFPLANILGSLMQKRSHKAAIARRENEYKAKLEGERAHLNALVQKQRRVLEEEYPRVAQLLEIALARGEKQRLWWRRPQNNDFLQIRVGTSRGTPSFSISLPNLPDLFDPLSSLPGGLSSEFTEIPDLPYLLNLKAAGCLGIASRTPETIHKVARRLILDLVVHHSPKDVHLVVLSDLPEAAQTWCWVKWLPHAHSMTAAIKEAHIGFEYNTIDGILDWLNTELERRRNRNSAFSVSGGNLPAIVVIIDDREKVRQKVAALVEHGHEVNISLIFLGDHHLPAVRAKLEVSDQSSFRYLEAWEQGASIRGETEFVSSAEMETVARAMAQIELLGESNLISLPESVRLSQVLDSGNLSIDLIKNNWQTPLSDRELLQFPIGIHVSRDGLGTAHINLLPSERGGEDAYHTMLIGTTGSGKSEFMKSLVLGAAFKYSPHLLNFFFLDFKGGAAFNLFNKLPHSVGVVNNLKPELVQRGLDALQNEITRRMGLFEKSGVRDIWMYNKQANAQSMPHLLLVLDEFTKGLEEFDRLAGILDQVVRQGRSLGMYLILANQNVNSAAENLLNNVGWRIALKVAKPEELKIIDQGLANARRPGHGYLRASSGGITELQSGYGGVPVISEESVGSTEDFKIYEVGPDARYREIYKHRQVSVDTSPDGQPLPSEETQLMSMLRSATIELELTSATPIYNDPLPIEILLEDVYQEAIPARRFTPGKGWEGNSAGLPRLSVPVGFLDYPKECIQKPLTINFRERDGHLWIVGAPSSGKALSLTTLLLSLAETHTPAEAQFYILDFSAGGMRLLENLPHTGAVLRLEDPQERLERLFNYLDQEMTARSLYGEPDDPDATTIYQSYDGSIPSRPDLFLVINNFAELRKNFADLLDRVSRIARNGKSTGIHLILATNRPNDLPREISNSILRRLILHLDRDELFDILQRSSLPTSMFALGRGFWMDSGDLAGCQVAVLAKQQDGPYDGILKRRVQMLADSWNGPTPRQIRVLPDCITLEEAQTNSKPASLDPAEPSLPVGISYDSLQMIEPNVAEEIPQWLVLGPKQSGKSNFLASLVKSLLARAGTTWEVQVILFRKSPVFDQLPQDPRLLVFKNQEDILKACQALQTRFTINDVSQSKLMLVIDDLGSAYESGKEGIRAQIDQLTPYLRDSSDAFLVASGIKEDLQKGMASPFVSLLRQSNTGMVFSNDMMILDWLGVQSTAIMPYKKLALPTGRGFFVSKGKPLFIQTLRVDNP